MTAAKKASRAIKLALIDTRVAKHPEFDAFCNEVAEDFSKMDDLKIQVDDMLGELFPPGAAARKKSARAALFTLNQQLQRMTPAERVDLFSSVRTGEVLELLKVKPKSHISVYHNALMHWFDVLQAMEVKPEKHYKRDHINTGNVRGFINVMAIRWWQHFGVPASSKNSPFYFAVEAVSKTLGLGSPAPNTVKNIIDSQDLPAK